MSDAPAVPDAPAAAAEAGLRYVNDGRPGITRERRGTGFSYRRPDGTLITDRAERLRIAEIVIPPAWNDVWISSHRNGHILATGRDDRGRKQYRYHPQWREVRDVTKFERLSDFGQGLSELRPAVDADLGARGLPRRKVLALVVRLLDESLIRIGNDSYAIENDSFGLTTLRADHVEVDGNSVLFDFVAKGGIEREVHIDDPELARIVHQCSELGGQDLFGYRHDGAVADVTSTDVNDYLRERMGADVTAKDFRTWGGTTLAATTLLLGPVPETERDRDKAVLASYDVAAEVLGNTRAVTRSSYVHPAVTDGFRSGKLHEALKRSRRSEHLDRYERTVLRLLGS